MKAKFKSTKVLSQLEQKILLTEKKEGKKMINEKEEYKKCKYCIHYKKGACSITSCPYLMERVRLGQIRYQVFLTNSFQQYTHPSFKRRLKHLRNLFSDDLFSSSMHKSRFQKVCREQQIVYETSNPSKIAILFLLTADNVLWTIGKNAVQINTIDFKKMDIVDIHADGYALFQVAKKISEGKEYTQLEEFGDETLITDSTFKSVINGILIAKHGLAFMDLKNKQGGTICSLN